MGNKMDNKIDLKGVARFLTLAFVPTVAVSAIIRSMHVNLADKMMIITIFFFSHARVFNAQALGSGLSFIWIITA